MRTVCCCPIASRRPRCRVAAPHPPCSSPVLYTRIAFWLATQDKAMQAIPAIIAYTSSWFCTSLPPRENVRFIPLRHAVTHEQTRETRVHEFALGRGSRVLEP